MKYDFIKTFERPNSNWVAMFVNRDMVGASGVEAIRSASKMPSVFNTIRTREGVHFWDSRAIRHKMLQLRELGLEAETGSFKQALKVLDSKKPQEPLSAKFGKRFYGEDLYKSKQPAPKH